MPSLVIEAEDLTRRYGRHVAIQNLSFSVGSGEIVALLGPNGAGKSTTMRILSSFMPASSGTARICGFDVFHESEEVRRRIGYMPENNPLYMEMRVREYLKFRVRLKTLRGRIMRQRVDRVLEQFGLTEVSNKVIGRLSKGFKQRVGLADALVHEPELLILDEPTIGLDPDQIRSVRQLIRELKDKHTVLISTHILHEAEMMCTRVLIMQGGRILADDTPENLERDTSGKDRVAAEIRAGREDLESCFSEHPRVETFHITPGDEFHRCTFTGVNGNDLRVEIFELARSRGWTLRELSQDRRSLEDIYLTLTHPVSDEENAP